MDIHVQFGLYQPGYQRALFRLDYGWIPVRGATPKHPYPLVNVESSPLLAPFHGLLQSTYLSHMLYCKWRANCRNIRVFAVGFGFRRHSAAEECKGPHTYCCTRSIVSTAGRNKEYYADTKTNAVCTLHPCQFRGREPLP